MTTYRAGQQVRIVTAYRTGQRVRVEWPDGSAAEGIVEWSDANGWAMPLGDIYVGLDALAAKPTSITILSDMAGLTTDAAEALERAGIAEADRDTLATVLDYAVDQLGPAARERVFGFWDGLIAFEEGQP